MRLAAFAFLLPMSEHPASTAAPPVGPAVNPGWGPWAPGVWLMQKLSPGVRVALLLALALLPALPWLAPSARLLSLPHAWAPLLAIALYGWACAGLVVGARKPRQESAAVAEPGPSTAVATLHSEVPPVLPALAAVADGALQTASVLAVEPDPLGDTGPSTPVFAASVPQPVPAAQTPAVLEPADVRVGHAEIRGATDEIARRVVGASGLLDASSKAAADALADIEALYDEDRHAQKLLLALRGRMLQLEQRGHALMRLALQAAQGEPGVAALNKQLQAVEALLLQAHQLAERLGAVEHQHGTRLESLRRSVERVDGHAERGLRESQQILQLTRRIFNTLDAAEQDLRRVRGTSRDDDA